MTTHHPDARMCATARGVRDMLAHAYETKRVMALSGQRFGRRRQDARIAGYEAQQSTTPTCPTCRAEMGRDEMGGAA